MGCTWFESTAPHEAQALGLCLWKGSAVNNSDNRDYAEEAENARLMLEEREEHTHTWVSGMMYVHPEDVHQVALMRRESGSSLPECETCEEVYSLD